MILKLMLKSSCYHNLPTKQQTRVKKFFGTLNYLGECIPNLSIESVNLRRLLEKNNKFVFDNPQTDAFDRLKRLVAHT